MNKYRLLTLFLLACVASNALAQKLRLVTHIGHSGPTSSNAFSTETKPFPVVTGNSKDIVEKLASELKKWLGT